MRSLLICLLVLWIPLNMLRAQEMHHDHEYTDTVRQDSTDRHDHHIYHEHREHKEHSRPDTAHDTEEMHGHSDHASAPPMSHAFSLNLPMTRNGSGTAWLPDASPMYGYMIHTQKWMYMLHGNLFVRYNKQDIFEKGSRGGEKWDVPNWVMGMGQRRIGQNGLFRFSAMLSFDPFTVGGAGYPLLFQTGETWQGKPLVDKQHPHDFFSELSVAYSHALSPKADIFIYLGYPGEPALGSVAFMHRPSAMYNPDAPLTHHWNDATHITFGVATLGFRYDRWKIEVSSFTGREPDENRYDFDRPRFNSRSVRLSYTPTRNWALQVSHGFLKSPEELHPEEDVRRTTASAAYAQSLAPDVLLNATAVWALNKVGSHQGEHGILAEASLAVRRLAFYTRYEWVQKSTEELILDGDTYGKDTVFPTHAWTLGAAYDVLNAEAVRISMGGQFSLYRSASAIRDLYGNYPVAAEVYLRLYPNLMSASSSKK